MVTMELPRYDITGKTSISTTDPELEVFTEDRILAESEKLCSHFWVVICGKLLDFY